MQADLSELVRELLESTGWLDRTRGFARTMRRSTDHPGGLLLVGTPESEPWHLVAHLSDEARESGVAEIAPTLVRWSAPPGAPPHLAVTMARLEAARRGETVLVVAEEAAPEALLERAADARRQGATVLAMDAGDTELETVAHESLSVVTSDLVVPELSFDTVQHLVSAAAGDPELDRGAGRSTRTGVRGRLARALDTISGSPNRGETGWR